MCGIFGVYSTTFGNPEFDLFEKLLYINVFRGQDSTGIIRVDQDKKVHVQKSILSSPEFIATEPTIITEKFGAKKPLLLMGHCRAATKGTVSLKNAHPFRFTDIVGMHNGTIHKKFEGTSKFETDSEALFSLIQTKGLQPALEEIEAYDTAYALQWVNMKDETLNFILNKKRPLNFAYLYGGQTLAWSSDVKMLKFAVEMSVCAGTMYGWEGNKKPDEHGFTLDKHDQYSIKIGGAADQGKITSVPVEEKKTYSATGGNEYGRTGVTSGVTSYGGYNRYIPPEYAALPAPKVTPSGHSVRQKYKDMKGRFQDEDLRGLEWLTKDESGSKDIDDLVTDQETLDEILPWKEPEGKKNPARLEKGGSVLFIKGYQGRDITENEMTYRLGCGCFCCGDTFDLADPHEFWDIENIHWWDDEYWACDTCYQQSEGDWVKLSVDGASKEEWEKAGHHGVTTH